MHKLMNNIKGGKKQLKGNKKVEAVGYIFIKINRGLNYWSDFSIFFLDSSKEKFETRKVIKFIDNLQNYIS